MTDGQQSTRTARTEGDEEISSDNRASMAPIENGTARVAREVTGPLDDQGTSQEEARASRTSPCRQRSTIFLKSERQRPKLSLT